MRPSAWGDRQEPRRPWTTDDVAILVAALGVTHWSSCLLAAQPGLSNVKIARAWREYGLQARRSGIFKFSIDPQRGGLGNWCPAADGLSCTRWVVRRMR
jgi:hypothetical protein